MPGKSAAIKISQKLGLPREITDGATREIADGARKFEDVLEEIEASHKKIDEERAAIEQLRVETVELKREIERKNFEADEEKNNIIKEASENAAKILEDAKLEATRAIETLRASREKESKKEAARRMEEVRQNLSGKIKKFRDSQKSAGTGSLTLDNARVGSVVFVKSFGQTGEILQISAKSQSAKIQIGVMKITAPLADLEPTSRAKNLEKSALRRGEISVRSAKTELDLRGSQLEPALLEIESFLDAAMLSNLSRVSIIHGKGTGALRKGVHEALSAMNFVKSFRLGNYGEGDSGVTIVELG
jgi:DNA mismatch repair protein MutS2